VKSMSVSQELKSTASMSSFRVQSVLCRALCTRSTSFNTDRRNSKALKRRYLNP